MPITESIRVMIVDDHDIVRRGIATFLSGFDDLLLVGEAANGRDALRVCGDVQPHVIMMDMMLPDMDGITLTRSIREAYPNVQIVMLTSAKDGDLVHGALQAGAISYMLKNISVRDMAETIRTAHAGQPRLAPEATQALIELTLQPRISTPTYNLTAREQTILRLMIQGRTNQEIADQIFVSRATVKVHVSTILSKLGVQNRVEAVRLAVQESLVD